MVTVTKDDRCRFVTERARVVFDSSCVALKLLPPAACWWRRARDHGRTKASYPASDIPTADQGGSIRTQPPQAMKKSPIASSRPNIAITPLQQQQPPLYNAGAAASPFSRLSPLPRSAANQPDSHVWNAAQVRADLQISAQLLSDRNLKLASKFATEQWMGLPADVVSEATISTPSAWIPSELLQQPTYHQGRPEIVYAKTLMELGEYAHAAAVLSQTSKSVETMPPPLSDLSAFGVYLRAYALYMAGEKRKEEDGMELKRYVCFSSS